MKRKFTFIFLIFTLSLTSFCSFAGTIESDKNIYFDTIEKIYIQPGNVYVASNALYININDELVGVNCLLADDMGVYVLASSLGQELRNWRTWTCPHCGTTNSFTQSRCSNLNCPSRKK